MTGGDLLCDSLLGLGVDVCFANPGTSEMHFVAALDRRPEMRCILGLFEGVVTGAADGFARMRRRPAATLLHTGPGLANGLANLHNARRAGSPMLNIVGDHAAHHLPYDAPLTSDIESLARPMSTAVRRLASADEVAAGVADAWRDSILSAGPVTLILPADTAWSPAGAPGQVDDTVPVRPVPDRSAIRETADAIRACRGRYALLVGDAAALRPGTELAGRIVSRYPNGEVLAEVLPARLARGRGCVSPRAIPYPIDQALESLRDIELLVLIGAPEPVAFFAYPGKPSRLLPEGCRVVSLASRTDDQLAALEALVDDLTARSNPPALDRPPLDEAAFAGSLSADLVGEVLARRLPEAAIVCDEGLTGAARFRALAHAAAPHDSLAVSGGSIGIGIPLAVGAAIACPDRKVVSLQADGSGLYTVQGLWTQARERLDVLTVILSNRAYAILQGELRNLGVERVGRNATRMMSLDDPPMDWVSLARGFGVEAARAETAETFADLVATAMRRRGPFLIECVI